MTVLTTVQGKKKGFLRLFKRRKDEEVDTIVESKPTVRVSPEVAIVETVLTSTQSPPPKMAPLNVNEASYPVVKEAIKPEKKTWISRTNYFKEMSNWAFDVVDVDGSGCVDEKELYSGLLLIHLKLGSYAGPAACRPVAREQVHDIFTKRDRDNSGTLDREEFLEVMSVLCGNIFTRVFAQWSLTLIIVPLVAKLILDGIVWLVNFGWDKVTHLEDYDAIENVFTIRSKQIGNWLYGNTPALFLKLASMGRTKAQGFLDMVPDSVWQTIPVTLVSCILGCLAVPYIIFKIDDYFQALAEKKNKNKFSEE